MVKPFKPMLAAEADLKTLRFPCIASPKLDGVRAMVINGVVMSRSLKPIPNKHVQDLLGGDELDGLDGELIIGEPTDPQCFNNTSGAVRRKDGEPDVTFYVFDTITSPLPFLHRWGATPMERISPSVVRLGHRWIEDMEQLQAYEKDCLECGYEGVILRDPQGLYKYGRSTSKEGTLLKLKQFKDSECRVLAVEELMHNGNEAKTNELGRTERSSHKENLIPAGTMGRLFVEDIYSGVQFYIGTGFSARERAEWWAAHIGVSVPYLAIEDGEHITYWAAPSASRSLSSLVKYKFFPVGVKDLPRHPVYLGLRDEFDLGGE